MDAKQLFSTAAKQASHCINNVHSDQLASPTPCSEWDLKTLLNHIVYELAWVPDMLEGKTVADVGTRHDGDLLGSDPAAAWKSVLQKAEDAVERADLDATVHLSYGDASADHYIREIASDVAIHGWDVGQSIKCNVILDDAVAKAIYDFTLPRIDELVANGAIAEALPVAATESIQTRLLGLLGRKAHRQE